MERGEGYKFGIHYSRKHHTDKKQSHLSEAKPPKQCSETLFCVLSEAQEDTASDIEYYSDGEEKRCPRVFFNVMTKIF